MTNLKQIIAEEMKEFEDFYWEKGKYSKRPLGIVEHKKFLSSALTRLAHKTLEGVELERRKIIQSNEYNTAWRIGFNSAIEQFEGKKVAFLKSEEK